MNFYHKPFVFWMSYSCLLTAILFIINNCLNNIENSWIVIAIAVILYLFTLNNLKSISFFQFRICGIITSIVAATINFILIDAITFPLYKFLVCMLSFFSIMICISFIYDVISVSKWVTNYRETKIKLWEQENNGAAPNPKDFE